MKITINNIGQITELKDTVLIANASFLDKSYIQIILDGTFTQGQKDLLVNGYLSVLRSDGISINNLLMTKTTTDGVTTFTYSVTDDSLIYAVTGTLQLSAQLKSSDSKTLATVCVAGFVQENIGIQTQEEYDSTEAAIVANHITPILENLNELDIKKADKYVSYGSAVAPNDTVTATKCRVKFDLTTLPDFGYVARLAFSDTHIIISRHSQYFLVEYYEDPEVSNEIVALTKTVLSINLTDHFTEIVGKSVVFTSSGFTWVIEYNCETNKNEIDTNKTAINTIIATLPNKVSKMTPAEERAYTTQQGGRAVSSTPTSGNIPIFNGNGNLETGIPIADGDVASKIYSDAKAKEEAHIAKSAAEWYSDSALSAHNASSWAHTDLRTADTNLQTQIDAITAKSDVVDIVATYAALQAYDTSELKNKNKISVLADETHDNKTAYYNWNGSAFGFVGIVADTGTIVKIGGVNQTTLDFGSDPQTQITGNKDRLDILDSKLSITDISSNPDNITKTGWEYLYNVTSPELSGLSGLKWLCYTQISPLSSDNGYQKIVAVQDELLIYDRIKHNGVWGDFTKENSFTDFYKTRSDENSIDKESYLSGDTLSITENKYFYPFVAEDDSDGIVKISSLTLDITMFPNSAMNVSFIELPTDSTITLTYSTDDIKFIGSDCDNDGIFVPLADKVYFIMIKMDYGTHKVVGIVNAWEV